MNSKPLSIELTNLLLCTSLCARTNRTSDGSDCEGEEEKARASRCERERRRGAAQALRRALEDSMGEGEWELAKECGFWM